MAVTGDVAPGWPNPVPETCRASGSVIEARAAARALGLWATFEIVGEPGSTVKDRAKILARFLKICDHLLALNNYHSLFVLLMACRPAAQRDVDGELSNPQPAEFGIINEAFGSLSSAQVRGFTALFKLMGCVGKEPPASIEPLDALGEEPVPAAAPGAAPFGVRESSARRESAGQAKMLQAKQASAASKLRKSMGSDIFGSDGNTAQDLVWLQRWSAYKSRLNALASTTPRVPSLAVTLEDLRRIQQGQEPLSENGLINWDMRQQLFGAASAHLPNTVFYPIVLVDQIAKFFSGE